MTIHTHYFSESSFIHSVGWSSLTLTMVVRFTSGTLWAYHRVPEKKYLEMVKAPSAGHYFNINIRDTHASERISYPNQNSSENDSRVQEA